MRVVKQGVLTKLSKGGFTANWNRREFALIGSSLFYAKDRSTLTTQPKLFAEIAYCEVWAFNAANKDNVLAIQLRDSRAIVGDDSTHGKRDATEMLLLAADTPRDKYAWMDARA